MHEHHLSSREALRSRDRSSSRSAQTAAHSFPDVRRFASSGIALLETSFAVAIVALFLTALFTANSRALSLLRSTKDSVEAHQAVRDRLEKLRSATWDSITSTDYIANTVLASNGNVFPPLKGSTITVSVTAFPPGKLLPASPILVQRGTSGTVSIPAPGDGNMRLEDAVRVEVTTTWPSRGGGTRTRQAFTVVSKNGIAGRKR